MGLIKEVLKSVLIEANLPSTPKEKKESKVTGTVRNLVNEAVQETTAPRAPKQPSLAKATRQEIIRQKRAEVSGSLTNAIIDAAINAATTTHSDITRRRTPKPKKEKKQVDWAKQAGRAKTAAELTGKGAKATARGAKTVYGFVREKMKKKPEPETALAIPEEESSDGANEAILKEVLFRMYQQWRQNNADNGPEGESRVVEPEETKNDNKSPQKK